MRLLALALLLISSMGSTGCVGTIHSQQPEPKWSTGFWVWGEPLGIAGNTLDVIFFHTGIIEQESFGNPAIWNTVAKIPDNLPKAQNYYAVFRHNRQLVPDDGAISALAKSFANLQKEAQKRKLNLAGIQLDIDSPTKSLDQYAKFLRQLRKELPSGTKISITALLDWFRDGTDIGDVIEQVDEYVPQFYDLVNPTMFTERDGAIAARINAPKWAPKFNRFKKPYRIGISTFGRSRLVKKLVQQADPSERLYPSVTLVGDLTPLDIAVHPEFRLETTHNEAGETVVTYRAARKTKVGYQDFDPGDAVQFILPTPESIQASVESAKQMQGYMAGVVFFRWPGPTETLVMQPGEVLLAAGDLSAKLPTPEIRAIDGGCAAVGCADVYLLNVTPLSSQSLRFLIHSSEEIQYVIPEGNIPMKLAGNHATEISLPPYCGKALMYLGRVVTTSRTDFSLERE